MSEHTLKPLKWTPGPEVGFSVFRRADGGMQFIFTALDHATMLEWREFALDHLLESDRLTRNLYDLRQVAHIPEEAIHMAVEANSDPSARNIRLAVVVASEEMREGILKIAALTTTPGGVEVGLFTSIAEAEAWLSRPLNLL
mgnify:CR=1 FL=1